MTERELAFIAGKAAGLSGAEALRRAGSKAKRPDAVASNMLRKVEIRAAIAEAQRVVLQRVEDTGVWSRETVLRALQDDRELARQLRKPEAAVSATMGAAKILKLTDADVVQDNRVQIAVGSLTDEQLSAILAVRGQM